MPRAALKTGQPNPAARQKKPAALYDPIFFRKDDVQVGVELMYMAAWPRARNGRSSRSRPTWDAATA